MKGMKIVMKKKDERLYNHNFIEACNNAVNGIIYAATTQSNVKKQLIIGVIIMILSLFYNFTTAEFLCLTFSVFFVIFAEMVNTAIETLVDLLVDVYHPKAKIAKDVAAGAVVLTACNAIVVAYFLFFRETELTHMGESLFSSMISDPTHLIFVGLIITVIAIVAVKTIANYKKQKNPAQKVFIPSGQTALAFAILTAIWINTKNPVVFCLSLGLSILVAGNRINDTRSFGEVVFGAFMGPLIVLMIFGLTLLRI